MIPIAYQRLGFGGTLEASARRMSKEGLTPRAVAMLNRARTEGEAFPSSTSPM
jgi:hypothetical protein